MLSVRAGCLLALAMMPLGFGQSDAAETWFRSEWDKAQQFPPLTDVAMSWRNEVAFVPGKKDLETRRSEAKELHVNDPKVIQLRAFERRLKKGPDVVRQTMRWGGERLWRLCQSPHDQGTSGLYLDYAVGGDWAWKMTPDWLVQFDPKKPYPDGHPLPFLCRGMMFDAGFFLFGGMRLAERRHLQPEGFSRGGDAWRAETAGPYGLRIAFEGVWDASAGRGFVERIRVTHSGGWAAEEGMTWCVKGWKWHPDVRLWLAQRVEQRTPAGELSETWVLESVRREAPGSLVAATALPDFGRVDSVRGKVSFQDISDYRGRELEVRSLTAAGVVSQSLPRPKSHRSFQLLGFGVAGLTTGLLLFLRYRKAKRRTRSRTAVMGMAA